jgi:serine phosphatase RsbU (regulator of sigma subunit)
MRCAYSWATSPAAANDDADCPDDPSITLGGAGGDIACAVGAPGAVRLLIGDVMGHDPEAARTAAAVTRAFRRLAVRPGPLEALAERLHAFVASHVGGEVFVTAQLIAVPPAAGHRPRIVCCGHPPPLLLRAGQVTMLGGLPTSPPLGLLDLGGCPPRSERLDVRPGDRVLLYTDGVSEAQDACGRPYPLTERAAALSGPGDDGSRVPELLADDLQRHVGGRLLDDATLLCLRFAARRARSAPSPRPSPPCPPPVPAWPAAHPV